MDEINTSFVILMADDDDDDQLLVESAFQELSIDHDLRFVDDGLELLNYLRNEEDFADSEKHPRPHLILLDLNMPRIDGREALRIIKSNPNLKDIPILIFTTSRERQDIDLSKQAGAASFLAKPDVFEDLKNMLGRFCAAVLRNPDIPFEVIGC